MAISKRLRYEVLRRDNHTCRYCGASAPDVKLHVDHVLPVALGGTDEAGNCVAACADCNAGKSSSNPDQPLVAQVSDDQLRWAAALKTAAALSSKASSAQRTYTKRVDEAWESHTYGYVKKYSYPRPGDWKSAIGTMYRRGLPLAEVLNAFDIAASNENLASDRVWRYAMGVCWKKLGQIEEAAQALYMSGVPLNGGPE